MSEKQIMKDKNISRAEFIWLIAALISLNAMAIDIVLPALPQIGDTFGLTNTNQRQLVLPCYMLGFGIAQLVYGPISDRFGRRAPLVFGLSIYCIAPFLAVFAPSFFVLLIMRFVQGVGAAATRVLSLSSVRDCYSGTDMAAIMSLVFMTFMIVPVIAPSIGQFILLFTSWHGIFIAMSVFSSIVGFWAYTRFPETLAPEKRRSLDFRTVIDGFRLVLTNRVAMSYACANMFVFGGLFGYLNSCQQIYVDYYGLGVWFPLAFASMASVLALAAYGNARFVVRFGVGNVSRFAVFYSTLAGVLLMFLSYVGSVPFWAFFIIMSTIMFSFGCTSSNINALSMEPLGAIAGTASSVFGFMQTTGGALIGIAIGQSFDGTLRFLSAGFIVCGFLALTCISFARQQRI